MVRLLLILCFPISLGANEIVDKLQDVSVTIKAGESQGSGVAFTRGDTTFIWTAGHIVDGLRKTRQAIVNGSAKTVVEFDDAVVMKPLFEGGRIVGRTEMDAEILKFSDADVGDDFALLRVRKKSFIKSSVTFAPDDLVPLGTPLYHVASPLGEVGSNSFTGGWMSQYGRLVGKKEFDQVQVSSRGGCSGGGVYTTDGKYIGMLLRGSGEGFGLVAPVRRFRAWAKRNGVMWAMDESVPVPSDEELAKIPIEDASPVLAASAKASHTVSTMEHVR